MRSSPTAGIDGETRVEKRRKVEGIPVEGQGSHQGRSIESKTVEAVAGVKSGTAQGEQEQRQRRQAQSEQQPVVCSGKVDTAAAFALDEDSQRLARQLFETIFGHLGKDFASDNSAANQAREGQNHSATSDAVPAAEDAISMEMPHTAHTIKQETAATEQPFAASADSLTLSPPQHGMGMDEHLIKAINADAAAVIDKNEQFQELPSDPWAPVASDAVPSWDMNSLGLDIGLDLNVDIDVDADSSLASSLGLHDVASDASFTDEAPIWA